MRSGLFVAIALCFGGCFPIPHTSERFAGAAGRVIDARTGAALGGVRVAVHEHPRTAAKSGADGAFLIRPETNFHLFLIGAICADDWPRGDYWRVQLDFTHPGYQPVYRDFSKREHGRHEGDGAVQVGTVPMRGR